MLWRSVQQRYETYPSHQHISVAIFPETGDVLEFEVDADSMKKAELKAAVRFLTANVISDIFSINVALILPDARFTRRYALKKLNSSS